MDYSYFGGPQQPYNQFLGMPHSFAHGRLDTDTTQSIEPLDPGLYSTCYDAFSLNNGLPTPQQGSPENIAAHTPMPVGSVDSGLGAELEDGQPNQTRSSSEEKDNLTPAQSRRKAQNRAAQRAFRERKERHVKELETKLESLESSTRSLQSDNERLKAALHRARTENEILRATSGHSSASSRPVSASYPSPGAHLPTEEDDEQEMDYSVESLTNSSVVNSAGREHSRTKAKGREIPAAQAWDFIQSHTLVKQGLVDVADVCERLKGKTTCDGHGPVFAESTIWQAIEESRRCGGDELI
ncbi:bzip transcription factor protein [Alternaria burnsii]|uniref:Bzip transcription factor protein n=1 Tax=Alternaria burnsii TaxID=1187904 RepID=A0A8H7BDF2_9PLEO|nr:bzip transcription factor protein [Alternaria burnsii]KAF7677358.1 bzip transcription factor protein [Alternaria burnsii]